MTDPTPVAFFNEVAREAAGRAFAAQSTMGRDRNPEYVAMVTERVGPALAAALEALPERSKAILALAELSDEELVERVARWTLERVEGNEWSEATRSRQDVYREEAALLLTALGLPVAEREATG